MSRTRDRIVHFPLTSNEEETAIPQSYQYANVEHRDKSTVNDASLVLQFSSSFSSSVICPFFEFSFSYFLSLKFKKILSHFYRLDLLARV